MDVGTLARERLAALAEPEKAAQMQRYMKTDDPFFGVQRPALRVVERELRQQLGRRPSWSDWETAVWSLWIGPERELRYLAIGLAKAWRAHLVPESVPVFERMVREGAWWDLVDDLAANCVGPVVLRHREVMRPVLERWIEDDDLWIRRTAILAQLKHKGETDADMLFDFCRRQAADKTFWIRKAIGWSLRQYARTDPQAVRAFLAEQGEALSGLSRREASKHL